MTQPAGAYPTAKAAKATAANAKIAGPDIGKPSGGTNAETVLPLPFLPAALALPDAQHSVTCITRAWTQLTQGFVTASLAQFDLARLLLAETPADWPIVPSPASADVAHLWLGTAAMRFDTAVASCRKINSELAASLIAAADSLWEAATEPGKLPPTQAAGPSETA